MKQSLKRARTLLDTGVEPAWQRLHEKRCRNLLPKLREYLTEHPLSAHLLGEESYFRETMIDFLRHTVEHSLNQVQRLQQDKRQFDARISRATSSMEREALMLDYARELGATPRQLRQDRRALGRWFGPDALQDRWLAQIASQQRSADFALQRLGSISAEDLAQHTPQQHAQRWQRIRYDDLCTRLLDRNVDDRLILSALQSLGKSMAAMPDMSADELAAAACRQHIYRLALDPEEPVWLQCEALNLMPRLAPEALPRTLAYRLQQPAEGDDLFVRARAVEIWSQVLPELPDLIDLADTVLQDPSALVRQRLARILPTTSDVTAPTAARLARHLYEDDEPAVRAQALLSLPELSKDQSEGNWAHELLGQALKHETDEFVYRTALRVWVQSADSIASQQREVQLACVNQRHANDPNLRIRRWSAQSREAFLCHTHPDYQATMDAVCRQMQTGARELNLSDLPAAASKDVIMRVLACMAQERFGIEADFSRPGRLRMKRLFKFGFRWWRAWYELRNPSTAKRQGHRHTIGRHFTTTERAPSAILAEVSQTKVPGEPLNMSDEDGWRPYLPLVDECLSALQQERKIEVHRIHTAEGITEIEPPARLLDQLRAWWQLTRNYEHFAAWRNWEPQDQAPASHYVEQLAGLGFSIRFIPHACPDSGARWQDDSVTRFFSSLLPIPLLPDAWGEFKRHLVSAYENTVFELAGYVAIIAALFFGRHIVLGAMLRRARRNIPLVVGGWGTRGKSGTERLKAAMFNALGLSVFSKTTGCEAMFVMNRPYRPLRELFLFRPYDKATIWEQFNMVRLASRLDSDVFLWECMGLTPSYVRVLQQDWMRDDISTITNAFPDHEDLQGPAGINIPQVMCEFTPHGGQLITSEEKMLPILRADAEQKNTAVHAIDWLHAGLLTPDVLRRFPYEEHPYNIALVLGIARQLGIDEDFALKEMADQVVMDLGVLKTYPTAHVGNRKLEFIMGMSANERFGALNNWTRMQMADMTPASRPDVWVSTVVNNRADRVARSRVFADLLVRDINADQHVLIGTNLKGLRGYIEESWDEHMQDFDLWSGEEPGAAQRLLSERAAALRIPRTLPELLGRLGALLETPDEFADAQSIDEAWQAFTSLTDDVDAITWGERFKTQFAAHQQLQTELADCSSRNAALESRVRDQLWQWFAQKLLIVEDTHISGDDLVSHIAAHAPPSLHNRIMGMQNIKGTGLGFVYAWQSWEEQHNLMQQLVSDDEAVFSEALDRLVNQPEFTVLARSQLQLALHQARHHHAAQRESAQAQIQNLLDRLEQQEQARDMTAQTTSTAKRGRSRLVMERLIGAAEAFFDAGDAVKRRRTADRVYEDLIGTRISEDRAISEIMNINKRQKGGWLSQRLNG